MKNLQNSKIIRIKEKTRYKLIFIETFFQKHFNELDSKKQKIINREMEIVNRLLNAEEVTSIEYQTIMSRVNKTIRNENAFNEHIRRIRNAQEA